MCDRPTDTPPHPIQAEASHPLLSHGAGALPLAQQHLAHMGRLIEDTEIQLRGDLDALYLQRTREVVHALRSGAAQDVGGAGTEGESEREATGQQEQEQHQQQRRPPAGAIRLPGMAAGPPGHQQSLFEAINRRRTQQQQEEDVVEG